MSTYQRVIILGNLGHDPEVRYTTSGMAVCNLRIATSRTWKNKDSGERQEETEWHSVTLYDRLAEVAGEYLRKGSAALIEGRLKTRKWQDKTGADRYTTEIVGEALQLLGKREAADAPERPQSRERQPAAATPATRAASAPRTATVAPVPPGATIDDLDDDIPF